MVAHVQRLSFAILVLREKNLIPVFNQKLRVRVIHLCVLYSNKYGSFFIQNKRGNCAHQMKLIK